MKITLTLAEIKAALITAAGKDETRHYLRGVLIERSPDGRAIIVSTNWHCITVLRTKNYVSCDFRQAIIPRELLEYASKSGANECELEIVGEDEIRPIIIQCDEVGFSANEIDGKFPNFRKVIPSEVSGEPGFFQNKYMAMIDKIAKIISHGQYTFYSGGEEKSSIAVMNDDCIFVIMPTREHMPMEGEKYSRPLFISEESKVSV